MLFIIQHQTSELWMKLAIREIRAACEAIQRDDLQPAFKMLARVSRIFEQLNGAWDVLRTMTPSDYSQFRDALGQSSGFQSWQYRAIEFLAGNRNVAMLKPHEHHAARSSPSSRRSWLGRASIRRRSCCCGDAASTSARRSGLAEHGEPHVESRKLLAAWAGVYRDPERSLGRSMSSRKS